MLPEKNIDIKENDLLKIDSELLAILLKDKTTGKAVKGWRIFDITDEKITLISAGCPEDFYHPVDGNSAYISEYILTGHINSIADASSDSISEK